MFHSSTKKKKVHNLLNLLLPLNYFKGGFHISAHLYYLFACARFLLQALSFIVYKPCIAKFYNFECK